MLIKIKYTSLLIIPHQDDEIFILPYLIKLIRDGHKVVVIYLTNGKYANHSVYIRRKESCDVLKSVGINSQDIKFVGENLNIRDGEVINNLNILSVELFKIIMQYGEDLSEILTPAWEGGHHDHDATNFIVNYVALKMSKARQVCQFYTYNAHGVRHPFYRVMHSIKPSDLVKPFKFSFYDGLRTLFCIRHYKSQYFSFIGLAPELIYRLIFIRNLELDYNLPDFDIKPHDGGLFYENRKRFNFDYFKELIGMFKKFNNE